MVNKKTENNKNKCPQKPSKQRSMRCAACQHLICPPKVAKRSIPYFDRPATSPSKVGPLIWRSRLQWHGWKRVDRSGTCPITTSFKESCPNLVGVAGFEPTTPRPPV
jgi:hypothetical protein